MGPRQLRQFLDDSRMFDLSRALQCAEICRGLGHWGRVLVYQEQNSPDRYYVWCVNPKEDRDYPHWSWKKEQSFHLGWGLRKFLAEEGRV
jgi:hypothetical protein